MGQDSRVQSPGITPSTRGESATQLVATRPPARSIRAECSIHGRVTVNGDPPAFTRQTMQVRVLSRSPRKADREVRCAPAKRWPGSHQPGFESLSFRHSFIGLWASQAYAT